MDELSDQQKAVELLQQLGFKEYEARCFVALSRLPRGTAKEISETSEVPRTRVYDAIRVLETRGLVEVQHSNPQQFRAVSIDEAVRLLRAEYEARAEDLGDVLESIDPAEPGTDAAEVTHEVWALTGEAAIENRSRELIEDADSEVVLIVGRETALTDDLVDRLRSVEDAGVDVLVGTVTEDLRDEVQGRLPDVSVYTSGLEWLRPDATNSADPTGISRLLLVDRNTILVSSVHSASDGTELEQAVFGKGFDNGIVVIARRMMATGLNLADDPGRSD
jgi:sugar-specific transcriptional regulator TrmB